MALPGYLVVTWLSGGYLVVTSGYLVVTCRVVCADLPSLWQFDVIKRIDVCIVVQ